MLPSAPSKFTCDQRPTRYRPHGIEFAPTGLHPQQIPTLHSFSERGERTAKGSYGSDDMEDGEFDKLTTLTREPVDEISTSFKKKCSELQAGMMKRCGAHGDQAKRNEAQIAITYCAARQVCPVTADDFRRIGKQEDMESDVQRFALMANRIVMQSRRLVWKKRRRPLKSKRNFRITMYIIYFTIPLCVQKERPGARFIAKSSANFPHSAAISSCLRLSCGGDYRTRIVSNMSSWVATLRRQLAGASSRFAGGARYLWWDRRILCERRRRRRRSTREFRRRRTIRGLGCLTEIICTEGIKFSADACLANWPSASTHMELARPGYHTKKSRNFVYLT